MSDAQIDAWMLLAVAYGRGTSPRAPLANVIAAADWINHAIPGDEEVERSLNRLIAAGLVEHDQSVFGLTDAGESLLASARKNAGLEKEWERLERALALEDPSTPSWSPAPGEVDRAVHEHHNRAAEIIASLDRRR